LQGWHLQASIVVAPGQLPGQAMPFKASTLMEGNCPVLMERVGFFELLNTLSHLGFPEQLVSSPFFPPFWIKTCDHSLAPPVFPPQQEWSQPVEQRPLNGSVPSSQDSVPAQRRSLLEELHRRIAADTNAAPK